MILLINFLFPPKSIQRPIAAQIRLDAQTSKMVLYQFNACPFCVKIRRVIKRLNLNVEMRDVLKNTSFESQLIKNGGKRQVPCLLIIQEDGSEKWLYESSHIKMYLENIVNN